MAFLSALSIARLDHRYLEWGDPAPMSSGAGGIDLRASIDAAITLSDQPEVIGTGLAIAIPKGYVGLLLPRSGLGSNGFELVNTLGVIDSDYRGEIKCVARNKFGLARNMVIYPGDRIAQLIIVPHAQFVSISILSSIDDLPQTDRGTNGFGSTGV